MGGNRPPHFWHVRLRLASNPGRRHLHTGQLLRGSWGRGGFIGAPLELAGVECLVFSDKYGAFQRLRIVQIYQAATTQPPPRDAGRLTVPHATKADTQKLRFGTPGGRLLVHRTSGSSQFHPHCFQQQRNGPRLADDLPLA